MYFLSLFRTDSLFLLLVVPLRRGAHRVLEVVGWVVGYIWWGKKKTNYFGPSEKTSPKDILPKEEIVCTKAPFLFI